MTSAFASTLQQFACTVVAGLVAASLAHRWRFSIGHRLEHWKTRIPPQRASRILLGFLTITYVVVFSTLSVLKHVNFQTRNDLAIHAQVMYNTSQGRWFDTTLLQDRPTNYLGHHFSPALLLLTPLYLLWPDAASLLIVQTVLLALGVVPIYLYARRETGSEMVATSMSAAYLLFPALHYANLFDFHEVVLAVPLLSFAAYWLLTRRDRLLLAFLVLALTVKEEMALVVIGFAFYTLLVRRRYRLGLVVLLLGILSAYLIMGFAMPALAGNAYFPTGRYEYLGASFGEVLRSIVFRPTLLLQHLLIPAKIEFVLQLLVPLGLLPLVGLETLILALPTTLYLILSDYQSQYSILYHYASPLIPLVFMAGTTGIARVIRWRGPTAAVAASALILVTSSVSYLLHGPGPLARHFDPSREYDLWPHLPSGYSALACIPAEASVMTPEEFAPHLAGRQRIYVENEHYLPVEYILQETVARTAAPRYPALIPRDQELLYPFCETVFDQDGYWVRRCEDSISISNKVEARFGDKLTLLAYQWRDQRGQPAPKLRPGERLDLVVAWKAEEQPLERYAFFVHLLDLDNHRWSQVDQEVERGVYPTTLWEPGMVVADHYGLTVPWGTPPGEYMVLIGAYSAASGQRLLPECTDCAVLDNALVLTPVQVGLPGSGAPPRAVSPQYRLDLQLNEELELVGYDLEPRVFRPGETVPLILTWRALADVEAEYAISLGLYDLDGATRVGGLEAQVVTAYPTNMWKRSQVLQDWHDVHVPADAPPGRYELLLRILEGEAVAGEASLGYIDLQGRPRQFTVPEMQHPLEATVGETTLFLGYDLSRDEVRSGDTLHLTLYWQAAEETLTSYTVFTHLLDADERIWGQQDSLPLGGDAPTISWIPGEVFADPYEIIVDHDAPPGSYVIEIGMYDSSTGQRLAVFTDHGREEGDRLLLREVTIVP